MDTGGRLKHVDKLFVQWKFFLFLKWRLHASCIHRTFWEIEMAKNIQSISRLLRERPHPGLRNEPPLDSLDPQSLNPFMASLWIGSGEGLAIKGFGDWGSRLSSGGSFWSPGWGRSRSSLEIDWIFFCHFNFPESAVCTDGLAVLVNFIGIPTKFYCHAIFRLNFILGICDVAWVKRLLWKQNGDYRSAIWG